MQAFMGFSDSISITVDVEDWPQSTWDRSLPIGDYCAENTRRLLELFSEFPHTEATFFILGKFAAKHPAILREIQQAGHEIASHGYGHIETFRLTREKFKEDIIRSTAIIADAIGVRPIGYRAPDFSIVGESLWALEILAHEGFTYDSSIFPIDNRRYGIPGWPRTVTKVKLDSGRTIYEFPMTTLDFLGRRLPISGGGYARLLPATFLIRAFRKAQTQLESTPIFYCHPYELDNKEFRRLKLKLPLKVKLHQNLGRRRTADKIRKLLQNFTSISLSQVISRSQNVPAITYNPYVLDENSVKRTPAFSYDE